MQKVVEVLSKDEQKLIVGCSKSNTDATRCVDPACYNTGIFAVQKKMGGAMGRTLSGESKAILKGIAGLKGFTNQKFKDTVDDDGINEVFSGYYTEILNKYNGMYEYVR